MNWRKIFLLVLLVTLLLQIQYFGLEDCARCRFGAEQMTMKEFFMEYTNRCLTIDETLPLPSNLSILESPKVIIE